jgi:Xaa-Pro aminopeptidase
MIQDETSSAMSILELAKKVQYGAMLMGMNILLSSLQEALHHYQIDGWLVYDFKGSNRSALNLLGVLPTTFLTRRFFYFVPRQGEPVKIVHYVDEEALCHLPGKTCVYTSHEELAKSLSNILHHRHTVAMEYWPFPNLPSQSVVDAATKEWVESFHVTVVSSWPIVSAYVGTLSESQKSSHRRAGAVVETVTQSAWEVLKGHLHHNRPITELQLQKFIIDEFVRADVLFDHPPIVAAGVHTAIPHHSPQDYLIEKDTLVLIDAWCKEKDLQAPYADLTHMAYTGSCASQGIRDAYEVVRQAQQAGISYVETRYSQGGEIVGADVDKVCRQVFARHGLESYFSHRTGHNIYTAIHGPAANLDSFETYDTRTLDVNHCYSIEPGVYLPGQYGIRLECNIVLEETGISVVGGAPDTLLHLF